MDIEKATRIFERTLLKHCAPVFAGIKPASMFSCHIKHADCCGNPKCASLTPLEFVAALADCSARLEVCGMRITMLAQREKSALLLVYRPDLLDAVLADERVGAFLESYGYPTEDAEGCIRRLSQRIGCTDLLASMERSCEFPHEVGLFLGYPYEDVMGFIDNQGRDFLANGCWKVYSSERDAADCFCRYKECARDCAALYEEGATIEQIARLGYAAKAA